MLTKNSLATIILLILSVIGCDNKKQIENSKNESNDELRKIEELKLTYETSIDSLDQEIGKISEVKNELKKNKEYAEAQIYTILKESHLDHITLGTEDIFAIRNLFNHKLGFSIKEGRQHQNGITNLFIEFEDSSEIEIISIDQAESDLAKLFKTKILQNVNGLQFAVRTNQLVELYNYFNQLNSEFSEFDENNSYSTLSKKNNDVGLPLFFIQHNSENSNNMINHSNSSVGINSVWLSSKELKSTIFDLADLGFKLMDKTEIKGVSNNAYIMENNNFRILLIDGDHYEISGISITIKDIDTVRSRLTSSDLNFIEYYDNNVNKILLSPETTKSIWFEFNEI